ncbi:cytochrome P450 [Streptomyces rapamycinicus]|nr:cytochrome P450 [Streptomyces rapamycinicus]AGP52569.1 cytochrome P450 [Streptomyces rapamycinicus NRRL 5491]MBB4780032.1 cytochrome P450 [Streptomyces rapamycinicus]UTP28735.1 cytochrome P450 [Streptomyces rapamycinicus NRRL 5491]
MSYQGGTPGWLITRHTEAKELLTHKSFSARQEGIISPVPTELAYDGPADPGAFAKTDDPVHSKYRKLVTGFFTVRRTRQLAPMIERIVHEQLDDLEKAGPGADLVEVFAESVPSRVMCEMIGVPESERKSLQRHVETLGRLSSTVPEALAAVSGMSGFLTRFVPSRMDDPRDDILGDLIRGGQLTEQELMGMTATLITGAFDTTGNMLAMGVYALLEHPDQLAKLQEDPELMGAAVEELLRFLTISHLGASRWALEDVEFAGQTIKKGEVVTVALPAVNRDPERYENPDQLDIGRTDHGHLGLGHGVHQCLGQHLARTILRVGYEALFDRFPTLRLAVPSDEIQMREDFVHYGPSALPVTWDD